MNLDKLDLQTERYIINRFISIPKKLILKEKWKAYPYNREYLVSNFGRVKYKNKLLKITLDNIGYCRVRIKGEVHRQIGLNGSAISKCCTHRLKTSQGYIWRYESEVVKENGTYRFTN